MKFIIYYLLLLMELYQKIKGNYIFIIKKIMNQLLLIVSTRIATGIISHQVIL